MKSPLEKVVQKSILDYLTYKRYFMWRNNNTPIFQFDKGNPRFRAMPKYTMKGIPDIIVITDSGAIIFIECKRKGAKLSEAQEIFKQNCERRGVKYITATSLDEVIAEGL